MSIIVISKNINDQNIYLALPAAIDITKMDRKDIISASKTLVDKLKIPAREIGGNAYQGPVRATWRDIVDTVDDITTYKLKDKLHTQWDKLYLIISYSKKGVLNVGVTHTPANTRHEFGGVSIYTLNGFKEAYLTLKDSLMSRECAEAMSQPPP